MLEIGTYTLTELKRLLKTSGKQATDRKLVSYGVEFSSDGRGDSRVYHITAIGNPFKIYCVFELGIPPQANFDKIRYIYYFYFCVDGFPRLPLIEKEAVLDAKAQHISPKTISKWIGYLQHLNYILLDSGSFDYYIINKRNGIRSVQPVEREVYCKAWAVYFEYRNKEGGWYAYQRMYNYCGGHPYKIPIPVQNAFYTHKINTLIKLVVETLPNPE